MAETTTSTGTPANGDTAQPAVDLQQEIQRTRPDYVVYVPKSWDGSTFDTGNEHFLVFDGPDNSLMAVWTQSSFEGAGDHRIMFSRSADRGRTWSAPLRIAGAGNPGEAKRQASWGFPLVSRSGRIYILYNQHTGVTDYHPQLTGVMAGVYSDDNGASWSAPETVEMPRSPSYDHPDEKIPPNWVIWQKPERGTDGRYLVGVTRYASPAVSRQTLLAQPNWYSAETVVEFFRFDNIDDNPPTGRIVISGFNRDREALKIPYWSRPELSVCQEASIVPLPDGRLFCVMRSMTGYIWYAVSNDGCRWCPPRPLRRSDHGDVIQAPLCCTPLYRLHDGRYFLVHQNNNAAIGSGGPLNPLHSRRPACIALGEFRPQADQPIWFSASKVWMDNDGVGIGPLGRVECGVYSSMTYLDGCDVFWHPDRKFFLVGKKVTEEALAGLSV